jgi:hypothetical protein
LFTLISSNDFIFQKGKNGSGFFNEYGVVLDFPGYFELFPGPQNTDFPVVHAFMYGLSDVLLDLVVILRNQLRFSDPSFKNCNR